MLRLSLRLLPVSLRVRVCDLISVFFCVQSAAPSRFEGTHATEGDLPRITRKRRKSEFQKAAKQEKRKKERLQKQKSQHKETQSDKRKKKMSKDQFVTRK